jgi:hypothetical protein
VPIGIWALEHVFTVSALLRFARPCGSRRGILTAGGAENRAVQVSRVLGRWYTRDYMRRKGSKNRLLTATQGRFF